MSVEVDIVVPAPVSEPQLSQWLATLNATALGGVFDITQDNGLFLLQPSGVSDIGFHVEVIALTVPVGGWDVYLRYLNGEDDEAEEPEYEVEAERRVVQVSKSGSTALMSYWFDVLVRGLVAVADGVVFNDHHEPRPRKEMPESFLAWRAELASAPTRQRYEDLIFREIDAPRFHDVPALAALVQAVLAALPPAL